MTVLYVVIAVIVGLIAAVLIARDAIDSFTIVEVKFSDFLAGSVIGILIGSVIGFLWIFTVPLAALIFGAWRLFLYVNKGAHRTPSKSKSSSTSWVAGLFKAKK